MGDVACRLGSILSFRAIFVKCTEIFSASQLNIMNNWTDPFFFQTGQLTVKQVESAGVTFPRHINLDPTGKWLLAAGQFSNTVSVFAVDQESGQLNHQSGKGIQVPQPTCILFK